MVATLPFFHLFFYPFQLFPLCPFTRIYLMSTVDLIYQIRISEVYRMMFHIKSQLMTGLREISKTMIVLKHAPAFSRAG